MDNYNNHSNMTADDYKENTKLLLNDIIKLTDNGNKIFLFEEPPFEPKQETYERALEVNDMGQPISKRTITGTYRKSTSIVEKDKGFGTYKRHNEDGTVDILALNKNQWRLKQITLAAITITDPHQFAVKCRMLWGGRFGVLLRWTCSEEFRTDFDILLKAIRNQIYMELMSAILDPELTNKAKLYLDILTKTNPQAFGKQVIQADVKSNNETKADTTLKITFGDL